MTAVTFRAEDHTYWIGGGLQRVPAVSEVVQLVTGQDYSAVPAFVLERAAERGRVLHAAIHRFEMTGIEPSLPLGYQGYFTSYRLWRDAQTDWTPEAFEEVVSGQVGESMIYGGTLDTRGVLNGQQAIVDYKSQSGKLTPPTRWKLAAYAYAAYGNDPSTRRLALHLRQDGKMAAEYDGEDWQEEWGNFETLLRAWWLRQRYGKVKS